MAKEVTNPDLLRQLEGGPREVTDPGLLRELEGGKPSMGEDVARAAGGGLVIAGSSIPGMIGDIPRLAEAGADALASAPGRLYNKVFGTGKYEDTESMKRGRAMEKDAVVSIPKATDVLPGGADIARAAAPYTSQVGMDPNYTPATMAGDYAKAISSNAALALAPGSAVQRGAQVILPGAAGETAARFAKGTGYETPARIGASAAASLGVSALGRLSHPERLVARSAGQIDDATAQAADALRTEARARGIDLTAAEAIQHVTNGGTKLGNLQRVIEGSQQGGEVMRRAMAQRPEQVDQAARQSLDQITRYTSAHPSHQGVQLQEAAQAGLERARSQINRMAEPYYRSAETVRLQPQEVAALRALPGYDEALQAVRSNPQLNRYVANLGDDTVGVLNEVKKQLDASARAATSPFNVQANAQVGAGYSSDAAAAANIGRGVSPDYRTALATEAAGRRQVLAPMDAGPLGQISRTAEPAAQTSALLRNNAQGAQVEATQAAQVLMRQNPDALRGVVRQDVEGRLNQATKQNIGGPNEWGGAKFAADVYGNPQQRQNLQAVLDQAAPAARQDIDRLMEALRATGQRHRAGSETAFNTELNEAMKGGRLVSEAMKPASALRDRVQQFRMGRNSEMLANLLLDPNGVQRLREMAARGNDSARLLARALLSAEAAGSRPAP